MTPRDILEREIGKPRDEWSTDDVVRFAIAHGVRSISLMHVGGDGWLKTLDFAPRSETHLRDIIDGGERADGSSLFPGMGISADASDVVLRPRPRTAFLDPFAERATLVLRCGHIGRDGQPLPQSPDTILRAAANRVREVLSVELTALGEVEFFLGKAHESSEIYGADDRGYHALSPFVFGQRLRRRAMAVLTDMGVPLKYGHSEVGFIEAHQGGEADGIQWEQHEIELALQPLPEAADGILLTQWVLRLLARREGMVCSTEPMMRSGHAGNGLHVHLSASVDGRHLAVDEGEGILEQRAGWLVGGLVAHGAALMAFGNTVEGSFARLQQGKEAPGAVRWGPYDRSALVRIPIVPRGPAGRPATCPTVEFRLPDGSALAHLLLAGIAQATIAASRSADLDRLLAATASYAADPTQDAAAPLPTCPAEVAGWLARSRAAFEAGGVFPPTLIDAWIERLSG